MKKGEQAMSRKLLVLVGIVAVVGLGPVAVAGECPGCKKVAETGEGFCCGKGLAYGVQLTSKPLYEALAGVEVQPDKITCPGCKTAVKEQGWCSHCQIGMAQGKSYHSPMAYALAKGKPYTKEAAAHCEGCSEAFAANGFCTKCNIGFVAGRMFPDRASYDAALAAHKTLTEAAKIAAKCETCAVAMVTNGTCEQCHVTFKDGKPTKG